MSWQLQFAHIPNKGRRDLSLVALHSISSRHVPLHYALALFAVSQEASQPHTHKDKGNTRQTWYISSCDGHHLSKANFPLHMITLSLRDREKRNTSQWAHDVHHMHGGTMERGRINDRAMNTCGGAERHKVVVGQPLILFPLEEEGQQGIPFFSLLLISIIPNSSRARWVKPKRLFSRQHI